MISSLITRKLEPIICSLLILAFGALPIVSSSRLILTPYIAAGNISEAQTLSRVNGLSCAIKSYSGYFTVNATTNSNLFFWFFPSTVNEEAAAPLILWLQGGPGTSSLFGLFVENGPFVVNENLELSFRNSSWVHSHSMLYIDSPVGTGYSFTDSDDGFAKTQEDVASDLHAALEQFFRLFPEYQTHDFYVAGESYAGKYVPTISYKIHQQNQLNSTRVKINLKGLMMGAGFSDPESMVDYYGEYLYNMGMIGEKERKYLDEQTAITKKLIQEGNYTKAVELQDELLGGDTLPYPTYFKNKTGYDFYFNVLHTQLPADHSYYIKYIQQAHVREAIHVDTNATFHNQSIVVPEKLLDDIFRSVKPTVEALLNLRSYAVLLYVGQFDIVVPHGAVYNFIKNMTSWDDQAEFLSTDRRIWYTGGHGDGTSKNIGGYIQGHENLKFVVLRKAGHNAPYDQPDVCAELISSFTSGRL